MTDKKVVSMLGLARRAGRLSMGHDTAQDALFKKKAKLLLLCSDASARLQKEFENTVRLHAFDVPVYPLDMTMDEVNYAIGYKAAVMTVDDENMAGRIITLLDDPQTD